MDSNLLVDQYNSELSRPELNNKVDKTRYFNGELLKPFEERSQNQGLLGANTFERFYPLWFHYENERNIYLWSQGVSLAERESYHIWIDPLQLIEKHRTRTIDNSNPFTSPMALTLSATPGGEYSAEESEYYSLLQALFERSLPHLHALSVAQQEVFEETSARELFVN